MEERLVFGYGARRADAQVPASAGRGVPERTPPAIEHVVAEDPRRTRETSDWGYLGLLAFTAVLYMRPQDQLPGLSTIPFAEITAIIGLVCMARDITERRRQDGLLKESELRYRQLGEGIFHQVGRAGPAGKLDYVNGRTMEYFNRSSAGLIGEEWKDVVHPDDLDECLRRWSRSVETGEFYETEFRLRRHDGVYRWHTARANCGRDETGNIVKWFGTNTDVDDQKQSEAKLNYFAKHDPLTDLPNRAEFMRHLKMAIDRADSNVMTRVAVLFLDLDRFKVINDSLGHLVGDELLRQIAERLQKHVRPGDVVAPLGGH